MTNQQLGYGKYGQNTYNTLSKLSGQNINYADPFKSSKGQSNNKVVGTQPLKPTVGDKATFLNGSKVNVMNPNEGGPLKQINDNIINNIQRETKRDTGISVPGKANDLHKKNPNIQKMLDKKFGDNSGINVFNYNNDSDINDTYYKSKKRNSPNYDLFGDDSTPNKFNDDGNINRKLYKSNEDILLNPGNTIWSSKSSFRKGHGGSMEQGNGSGITVADCSIGKGIKEMYLFSENKCKRKK